MPQPNKFRISNLLRIWIFGLEIDLTLRSFTTDMQNLEIFLRKIDLETIPLNPPNPPLPKGGRGDFWNGAWP